MDMVNRVTSIFKRIKKRSSLEESVQTSENNDDLILRTTDKNPWNRREDFNIKYNIFYNQRVGGGSGGTVYRASLKSSRNSIFAVKVVEMPDMQPTGRRINRRNHDSFDTERPTLNLDTCNPYTEVENYAKVSEHPNVAKLFEAFQVNNVLDGNKIMIVMEYVMGGPLISNLYNRDFSMYSQRMVQYIVRTLVQTLDFCKGKDVIHRDIKLGNVLLDAEIDPRSNENNFRTDVERQQYLEKIVTDLRLVDFGLSISRGTEFNTVNRGTVGYMAPEVLSGTPYDFKCDVWSVGVLCYRLLSGSTYPVDVGDTNSSAFNAQVYRNNMNRFTEVTFNPPDMWLNKNAAKEFLKRVLVKDPALRYDYADMLEDPWLKNLDDPDPPSEFVIVDINPDDFKNELELHSNALLAEYNTTSWQEGY